MALHLEQADEGFGLLWPEPREGMVRRHVQCAGLVDREPVLKGGQALR
jgi:hypothetical protein